MACYHPLTAYRGKLIGGGREVVFNKAEAAPGTSMLLPCGTCLGCRLEYARQWSVRCGHEVKWMESQGRESCFLTLTYSDDKVPPNGSLRPDDVTLFLKRLRKSLPYKIRYFQCGEYGERTERPHHHMLLFGHNFSDRVLYSRGDVGTLYESRKLDALWGHGACKIGEANFDSAGYVARYSLKKLEVAPLYWNDTGRVAPYLTMSRNPGIGALWWLQFCSDWYAHDKIVVNGVEARPPKYYDSLVEKFYPAFMQARKARRASEVDAVRAEDNYRRGYIREEVKTSALVKLTREGF